MFISDQWCIKHGYYTGSRNSCPECSQVGISACYELGCMLGQWIKEYIFCIKPKNHKVLKEN